MLGSDEQPKDVLEYLVIERHLVNPYGRWRLHGKIVPSWAPAKDSIIKVTLDSAPAHDIFYISFTKRKGRGPTHTSCQKEIKKPLLTVQFILHFNDHMNKVCEVCFSVSIFSESFSYLSSPRCFLHTSSQNNLYFPPKVEAVWLQSKRCTSPDFI